MKTITSEQNQTLEDLSAEGLLGGLPLQTAEKDIHITDLLYALSQLKVHHAHFKGMGKQESARHDDGIVLVFAGGTCLSKAHGLIERMSEDIDLKVILTDPTGDQKLTCGPRVRLKALHKTIGAALEDLGFDVPARNDDKDNPYIRDERRYWMVNAAFQSSMDVLDSLRPNLKLEVIHRPPLLPWQTLTFGYLYESLSKLSTTRPVSIACIDVAETLGEKVLSLLRRCHWKWSGQQKGEMDEALVRHMYDVYRIMQERPDSLDRATTIFKRLVDVDAEEFGNQAPDFRKDPGLVLSRTLADIKDHPELQRNYERRLLPLIYQGAEVDYATAYGEFDRVARIMLDAL
ncbi:nucleotidyl transferase AbiEii/AbiGii toxin family protein [Alcaligenes faecalis]|uniref:nucleotidyl transferase AbiEii/AbiGii toxin family protein n=1 Tax=Alcaligenes faecalis TaxID=511 RepID=UPI001EF00E5F|nr:nucleotidyl transferase AbiEii/AbiGii toxin family protein [Alcaligenes faecalis]ULH06458.1 nucleotidyl transferase AbiEii/AbiGii toxin family protein [Alcaligenes faecalis]